MRSADPILFLSRSEKKRIVSVIKEAEQKTSAEIRVHLDHKINNDVLEHAKSTFQKLGMTHTKARNAVLIFISVRLRQFAVLGDVGIHQKVSECFWKEAAAEMENYFRVDRFAEGIVAAIDKAGEVLKRHFPRREDDANELRDGISYSL